MGYYTDQEQKDIIAKNLIALISSSGKDQRDISIDLDVNPPTFNQWVNGKAIPSISMLRKVAEYFNVNLSGIIDREADLAKVIKPSELELKLLASYRKASSGIREAVEILLHVEKE